MSYGRRFRTAPYETASIELEDTFDTDKATILEAHDILKHLVDTLVEADKEDYARESATHPQRK